MAHGQITAQSWTHRIYIPIQNRFVHSGQVQLLENLQRTPEMILSPSYGIDKEKGEYNTDEYNKKLSGLVHFDPEDGVYYSKKRVFDTERRLFL